MHWWRNDKERSAGTIVTLIFLVECCNSNAQPQRVNTHLFDLYFVVVVIIFIVVDAMHCVVTGT